jgi:hypothetical protein
MSGSVNQLMWPMPLGDTGTGNNPYPLTTQSPPWTYRGQMPLPPPNYTAPPSLESYLAGQLAPGQKIDPHTLNQLLQQLTIYRNNRTL